MLKLNEMRRLLVISLAFLSFTSAYCQTDSLLQEVRDSLNYMFLHLDKTRVPTGLLYDYAVNYIEFESFDGVSPADSLFYECEMADAFIHDLSEARVNSNRPFSGGLVSSNILGAASDSLQVNIGFIAAAYNKFASDALSNNLVAYSSGQFYDVYSGGTWLNPYDSAYVFCLIAGSSNVLSSSNVTFSFSENCFFSNIPDLAALSVDAGDGAGFRQIPLSGGSFTTVYYEDGAHKLQARLTLQSGVVLSAICYITSYGAPAAHLMGAGDFVVNPDDVTEYTFGGLKALVSVKYSQSDVRRPFIVAEGYDPGSYALLPAPFNNNYGNTSFYDVYPDLPFEIWQNYDIYYIDWKSSDAGIQYNAALLEHIITQINQQNASNNTEMSIIMGQSMGGLIVRYALCDMESRNVPHNCRMFISDDAPHFGANIPIGALYIVKDIINKYDGNFTFRTLCKILAEFTSIPSVNFLKKYYTATSTRQLLYNYIDLGGNLNNSVFDTFQTTLDNMGFPKGDNGQGIELACISNGGDLWFLEDDLAANDGKYLDFTTHGHVSVLTLLPITKFNLTARVYPFRTVGDIVARLKMTYRKSIMGIPVNGTIFDNTQRLNQSILPDTSVPGSYLSCARYSLPHKYGTDDLNPFADFYLNMKLVDFMFIPSVSSLAYKHASSNLSSSDWTIRYPYSELHSTVTLPFDSYYIGEHSSLHISLDSSHFYWNNRFKEWLVSAAGVHIVGPEVIRDADTLCLEGNDANLLFSWSSSDESVVSVNNSGVLTRHRFGKATITAQSTISDGKIISKKKEVIAGFPLMALSNRYEDGIGYVITASCCDSTEQAAFDECLADGKIKFRWRTEGAGAVPLDMVTSSCEFVAGSAPTGGSLYVICTMFDPETNYSSETYYQHFDISVPYLVRPDAVLITDDCKVKFMSGSFVHTCEPDSSYPVLSLIESLDGRHIPDPPVSYLVVNLRDTVQAFDFSHIHPPLIMLGQSFDVFNTETVHGIISGFASRPHFYGMYILSIAAFDENGFLLQTIQIPIKSENYEEPEFL